MITIKYQHISWRLLQRQRCRPRSVRTDDIRDHNQPTLSPPERDYHENRQKNVRFACGGTSLYIYCSASLLHRKNGNTELRACPEVGQTSVSATIVKSIIIYGSTNKALEFPTLCLLISLYIISMIRLSFTIWIPTFCLAIVSVIFWSLLFCLFILLNEFTTNCLLASVPYRKKSLKTFKIDSYGTSLIFVVLSILIWPQTRLIWLLENNVLIFAKNVSPLLV